MAFKGFKIGRVSLRPGHPLIAGVLNITPDSFSDGGLFFQKENAMKNALRMEEEGADYIDIGGESSRPGAEGIQAEEEIRRVIPVIRQIRRRSTIPISIDTCKPEVVSAALDEGVDAINDITGFRNPEMVAVAAKAKKPVTVMHMKDTPRTMQKNPRYGDVVSEIAHFLKKTAASLEKEGVRKIIIDPGIGFGKTLKHNLQLLNNINRFAKLGYPVLVGASRKSFIGMITGAGVKERLGGSLSAHILAIMQGAAVIRVHDVAPHRQALDVALQIIGTKRKSR